MISPDVYFYEFTEEKNREFWRDEFVELRRYIDLKKLRKDNKEILQNRKIEKVYTVSTECFNADYLKKNSKVSFRQKMFAQPYYDGAYYEYNTNPLIPIIGEYVYDNPIGDVFVLYKPIKPRQKKN